MKPLHVNRVTVRRGRLVCDVEVADPRWRFTTPELAERTLQTFPSLAHHACVNERGRTFSAVIAHTPLPHLLEHLVIDIQVRASGDPRAAFAGTTCWTDEPAGRARVEVEFADDLDALGALCAAADFISDAVVECGA